MPRLRHVDCAEPGFGRRRCGRGFVYLDERGARLDDPETLARIQSLVIPPAWTDVWISRVPNGHLQAVGVDNAGRRQYLYHPAWREQRDRQKFESMVAFARSLPRLRSRASRLLGGPELTKDRVLGFAVTLLDRGLFRVGGEEYAEENGSYGLTTLERRHVRIGPGTTIVFDYIGKTGQRLVHEVVGRRLAAVADELKRRPGRGKAFLAFTDGDAWSELRAAEINAFIKSVTGDDNSAKDFRTWHATVLAATSLAVSAESRSGAGRRRAITRAAEDVAEVLGNTPAVCRSSYIDPRIFDLYRSGATIPASVAGRNGRGMKSQRERERAVLRLLAQLD